MPASPREKEPRYGSQIAFSPDGKLFADGFRLWELASGKVLRNLPRPGETSGKLTFSPDGKLLASVTSRTVFLKLAYDVRVWDIPSGKVRRIFGCYGDQFVAFSPDGKLLANPGPDGTVKLTSLGSGKSILRLDCSARAVAFGPGDHTLIAARGPRIERWDWTTGRLLGDWPLDRLLVDTVACSPDGKLVVAAGTRFERSSQGQACLIEASTGHQVALVQPAFDFAFAIAFSPDGKLLALAGGDSESRSPSSSPTVELWDISSHRRLSSLHPASPGRPTFFSSVAFSPDGKLLCAGRFPAAPTFWKVDTGEEAPTLSTQAP